MFLKRLSFGSKEYIKELKVNSVQILWAILVNSSDLGLIIDPLMVSKFQVFIDGIDMKIKSAGWMFRMVHSSQLQFPKKILYFYFSEERFCISKDRRP